jgi:hypothetical protein
MRSATRDFFSRSHDAVIRIYDEADNVVETHEHSGELRELVSFKLASGLLPFVPPDARPKLQAPRGKETRPSNLIRRQGHIDTTLRNQRRAKKRHRRVLNSS